MMRLFLRGFQIVLPILLALDTAQAQGGGGGVATCSGVRTRYPAPSLGQCLTSWADSRREQKLYPDDFQGILNKAEIYVCPSSRKRVIISNGIPDHSVTLQNNLAPCEVNWAVEMPLYPTINRVRTEVPIRGMLAMAMNGVPTYGPQESDSLNAVEGMGVPGARFWYGHTGGNSAWHVHHPNMGQETGVTSDTLLGYAMDGFPIYGPVADDSVLDACNGMVDSNGNYQYHVRTMEQVDGDLEYCNGSSPETNWNYILGCYSGSVAESRAVDSTSYTLDSDCVLNDQPLTSTTTDGPTKAPAAEPNVIPRGVNVILMQPDDLEFFDEWSSPPNNPSTPNRNVNFPNNNGNGLPNIERLRVDGLQMMQAYTASPVCGTSRFATITGKYPSRAASNTGSSDPQQVTIPTTKLEDRDCTRNNMAAEFQRNGYRTAMIGKWHLSSINDRRYTYESAQETVKGCGFTTVDGLYVENLKAEGSFNNFSDGTFSHNMEWLTWQAIQVINENSRAPFFMYFNPTVPHGSNDVGKALRDFSCQDTANGSLGFDPMIPGMTEEYGSCEAYRQTIFDRSESENDYGPIWLDDSVGALLKALEDKGILDSTIFLFQIDHGMDAKSSLYEGGARIPQFVHYPGGIGTNSKLDVPVSNVDIAATMFDFTGISPSYETDGMSWKDLLGGSNQDFWNEERCLFFELDQDRAVRCGCFKYLSIFEQSEAASATYTRGTDKLLSTDSSNLFDLCDGTSDYITDKRNNREDDNIISTNEERAEELAAALQCHTSRTDESNFSTCNLNDFTETPTKSPTMTPTQQSPAPSISTNGPTLAPSLSETEDPTLSPSLSPVRVPTSAPTSGSLERTASPTLIASPSSISPSSPTSTDQPVARTSSPTAAPVVESVSTPFPTVLPDGSTVSPSIVLEEENFSRTPSASPTIYRPVTPTEDNAMPETFAPTASPTGPTSIATDPPASSNSPTLRPSTGATIEMGRPSNDSPSLRPVAGPASDEGYSTKLPWLLSWSPLMCFVLVLF